MVMNASHIRENIFTEAEAQAKGLKVNKNTNYHGLGKQLFLDVIDSLDNVTEAYRGNKNAENPARRENYFILISSVPDSDGNRINVPIYVNETAKYNNVFIDANKIATVFGRKSLSDYIARQIANGNLIRIKNRSALASEVTAPITAHYSSDASVTDTITPSNEKVKPDFSTSREEDLTSPP